MNHTVQRVAVYNPSTQHSVLLAKALTRLGYETSLITRFETESAIRQSAAARMSYKALGRSRAMRRAIENRTAHGVRSFSTDPMGILFGRLINEALGRSARHRFERSRMRHSAKIAAKLMRRQLHPDLVIAAETGSRELFDELDPAAPVVIDVAHPHPKEVDRCRQLATARYPDLASSWDDAPLEASNWQRLDEALTRATGVWTASRYTADAIHAFVDPAIEIDVVGYGIACTPQPPRGSTYEGRYLFVGAVGLRKGVPLLLEAWTKSGLADEGCVLDLVGKKFDSQIEIAVACTAGVQRHFDISSEALRILFQRADALVCPSYCEGFGRVLIEAVIAGIPFLATRTGAVGEILGPELKEWSVEVDDLEGFTDMLRRFHDQGSWRADLLDAVADMQVHWTAEAYGLRLQSAVERRFNRKLVREAFDSANSGP